MNVYVVMGNDYPAGVFLTRHEAEAYCEKQRKLHDVRIYWKVYAFRLVEEATDDRADN